MASGETAHTAESGANLADSAPMDADLQAIIERWPIVSMDVKGQIVALVDGS